MTKLLIGLLSLALVGTGGLVAAVGGFDVEPAGSVSVPAASTDRDTTTAAATTTTDRTTTDRTTTTAGTTTAGVDVSGPCDEAEHANDPRCTGAGGDDDGNSGPGGGGEDRDDRDDGHDDLDDRDDDDRSGSNSGRG
ncbi:MAG TPA: hypothetical protein VF044_00615 [Actinomycetota bacterium]